MAPSVKSCPNCQSSTFDTLPERGDVYCVKCGNVIESDTIVSEVQFEEGAHGAARLIGTHVGEGNNISRGISTRGMTGIFGTRESRQVTLDNAKRKIRAVAAVLKLNDQCVDIAHNFYRRALQKRLTHGRKNTHVIAACVYMTCRTEQTSHILLDLSDVMQVNVYELGRTFMKLATQLKIHIPTIDPCLYIIRYASKLDLGDKTHEIEQTAMHIVRRMKYDFIHIGRRPSGLCGSALLVAARMHDVYCSVKDIIDVVKVCETTIRKRLSEFGDTPSSKLTIEDFMNVHLGQEEDPPCFKTARKKIVVNEEVKKTVSELEKQIEEELEKTRKKVSGPYAAFIKESPSPASAVATHTIDEDRMAEEIVFRETLDTVSAIIGSEVDVETTSGPVIAPEQLRLQPTHGAIFQTGNGDRNDKNDKEVEEEVTDGGELTYDDLDDKELDSYILDEKESRMKTLLWEKVNSDWMEMMAEKERRRQEDELELKIREEKGELPPPKKKRKARRKIVIQANSAGEAIEKMLAEKRISSKINYDVLKNWSLDTTTVSCQTESVTAADKATDGEDVQPTPPKKAFKSPAKAIVRRLPSIRNFVPSHIRLPTRSRTASTSSSVITEIDLTNDGPPVVTEKRPAQEPAVEEPPAKRVNVEVEVPQAEPETDFDDDEEDEDEGHVSITTLMSQRLGHDDGDHDMPLTDVEEF